MDFNKARTFVSVVDFGGITSAAKHLLRTQQAISLQLQQLEHDLGINLFDRHGPNLTLTKNGEQLYQAFKPKLMAMENAVLSLKSSKKEVSGIIRIGAWMEQAVGYLPEMMRLFKQDYPLVEFDLIIGDDVSIERDLIENKIDLGLQVYCQDKKLLKQTPVYRQPMLPVVSRTFLKHYSKPSSLESCFDIPLVDYLDTYSAFNNWVKKNNKALYSQASKKVRTVTTSNNVVLKQLVLQGLGMGFLHLESIRAELETGELIALFDHTDYQHLSVNIDLVHKRKHALGFIHLAFIRLLEQHKESWSH